MRATRWEPRKRSRAARFPTVRCTTVRTRLWGPTRSRCGVACGPGPARRPPDPARRRSARLRPGSDPEDGGDLPAHVAQTLPRRLSDRPVRAGRPPAAGSVVARDRAIGRVLRPRLLPAPALPAAPVLFPQPVPVAVPAVRV